MSAGSPQPSPPLVDPAPSAPGLRTLGTGPQQAAAGDDPRFLASGELIGIQSAPGTLLTVYVRSAGNDTTGNGTLALPYLTPERALQDCPSNPSGKSFRIDMTGYGTYTPAAILQLPVITTGQTTFRPSTGGAEHLAFGGYRNADIEFYAEPTLIATFTNGQYTTAQYGGTANKAAHTVVTITSSPGWTVNEHVGKMLVLSGNGICARVISNTVNTLTVTMTYGFSTTSTLKLCTESCSIDLGTAFFWLSSGIRGRGFTGCLTIAGLKFVNGFYADNSFRCTGDTRFYGCYNVAISGHEGGSLRLFGCDVRLFFNAVCQNAEMWNCVYTDLGVHTNSRGALYVFGCYGTGGDSIGEGFYHGIGAEAGVPRTVSVFYTTHRDTARGGVRLVGQGNTMVVGYCHLEACSYGGIVAQWEARCFINGPISGPTGVGTPQGGGVVLRDGAQLLITDVTDAAETLDSTNITVTGSGGDLYVDGSVMTWTEFFTKKALSDLLRTGSRAWQIGTQQKIALLTVTAVKTVNYTAADYELVLYDSAGGPFTVTIPPANAATTVTIKNKGASTNPVTLSPTGGDSIDGAPALTMNLSKGSITLYSDAVSDWMVI